MPLRNGEHGYGAVTTTLHWLTVTALIAQFVIGYVMDADESGRGRGRGRGEGSGRGRGRGGEDYEWSNLFDGEWRLVTVHVVLGLTIMGIAGVRMLWRNTGLPPWAQCLSELERRLVHWTERLLLLLLIVMPATGLALVFGDDDYLPLHVSSHIAFFVVIALHVGMVVKKELLDNDRFVHRMLPGVRSR